jgi:hypothetical protein
MQYGGTWGAPYSRDHTLVKIDVEGAEMDVLEGAMSWLNPTNYFVIEVHQESFLDSIPPNISFAWFDR